MSGILSLNVSAVLVFGVIFLLMIFVSRKRRKNIPGPVSLPVIGNYPLVIRISGENYDHEINKLAKKYGNIFQLFYGKYRVVYLYGHENLLNTFVKNSQIFSDRPNRLPVVQARVKDGIGIIWSNGGSWKKLRRFALQAMRDFGVGKKSLESVILDEMKAVSEILKAKDGKPITNIRSMLVRVAGNVIHSVVFGFRYPHDSEKFKELMTYFEDMFKGTQIFNHWLTLPLWLSSFLLNLDRQGKLQKIQHISSHINEQINEHRDTFDPENIRDFVDLYLKKEMENKNSQADTSDSFGSNNLRRMIFDLFIAGAETTGTTAEWQILYLMAYPEVQEKCFREIQKVVGTTEMVHYADRSKMTYVEATMLEIQRVSNVLVFSLPRRVCEDTIIGEYIVPKNTIVLGSLQSAHFDENVWDKPRDFRPERFIDSNGKICNRELLVPFSLGPRSCIGEPLAKMEIFLTFANLIQRFKFAKANESDILSFEAKSGATRMPLPYRVRAIPR